MEEHRSLLPVTAEAGNEGWEERVIVPASTIQLTSPSLEHVYWLLLVCGT